MNIRLPSVLSGFASTAIFLLACGADGPADAAVAAAGGAPSAEGESTTETVPDASLAESVAEANAGNAVVHGSASDCEFDPSGATRVTFDAEGIIVNGGGAQLTGNVVTITSGGTYLLEGAHDDAQVVVSVEDEQLVKLVLNGVQLRSAVGAPLAVMSAEQAVVVVAEGSDNLLADAPSYVYPSPDQDEPNAALFSAADLTLCGGGQLRVEGNYNDGIASKDGLVIRDANVRVDALDDALRGKDYVLVSSGSLELTAGGDGLKADNEEDAERGFIRFDGGDLLVTAGGDAIAAQTDVLVSEGTLTLRAGAGSLVPGADDSAKGIKGLVNVIIEGGVIDIDAVDDALHSNGAVVVSGGTLALRTDDDAIHGDVALEIAGGNIDVSGAYEGLESQNILVRGGHVRLVTGDDGVNAAGGSTATAGPGGGGASADVQLTIAGGELEVDASGDGIDSNGSATIAGGTVVVNGPTGSANSALDCNGEFAITGGTLTSAHIARMADEIDGPSTQNYLEVGLDAQMTGGALVHLRSAAGDEILTFAPSKDFKTVVLSTASLQNGQYELYLGGSESEAVSMGIFGSGGYTAGSLLAAFSVTSTHTTVGNVWVWV